MASSFHGYNAAIFAYVLMFVLCFMSLGTSGIGRLLLHRVCSETRNPSFCFDVLFPDPRTDTADIWGLESTAINLAMTNAAETKSYIDTTLLPIVANAAGNNEGLKQKLMLCSDAYALAMIRIRTAAKYLDSGKYDGIRREGAALVVLADGCEAELQTVLPSSVSSSSLLTTRNAYLGDLGSIIEVTMDFIP